MNIYQLDRAVCDNEADLANIAALLNTCDCPEMLEDLREIFPPAILNKAAKRLTPEKHSQIKYWAIALNNLAASPDAVQNPPPPPPPKPEIKAGDYIQFGNHFGYLRAKNPKGQWLVEWVKNRKQIEPPPSGAIDESLIKLVEVRLDRYRSE